MKSQFAAEEVLCAVKIVEASINTFDETVEDVVNLKNQNLWEGEPEERILHETQFQVEISSSMGKSKFHSYWEKIMQECISKINGFRNVHIPNRYYMPP